jgi:hypothetical protein
MLVGSSKQVVRSCRMLVGSSEQADRSCKTLVGWNKPLVASSQPLVGTSRSFLGVRTISCASCASRAQKPGLLPMVEGQTWRVRAPYCFVQVKTRPVWPELSNTVSCVPLDVYPVSESQKLSEALHDGNTSIFVFMT